MNRHGTPTSPADGTSRGRSRPALAAGAIATVALAAAAALPSSAALAAPAGVERHGSSTRPTVVLVHGAWADGSSWNAVVKGLQSKGYPVEVAPNPGRGVKADTAYLASFLATISGPVVLVGHSYGGFITTNAATGNENVKALVYVDAFAPDAGESIASLTTGSGSVLEPALTKPESTFTLRPFPGAVDGAVDAYVLPRLFVSGFAADLPRADAAALAAQQTPLATSTFAETSGEPAWRTIPSWALVGTADKVIPQAGQEAMAHRAGAHITTVKGSHLSLISHPRQTVGVIVEAARATD